MTHGLSWATFPAMANFILLAVCFAAGLLLRRARLIPENAPATLNVVIIYVSLPAVALKHVHALPLSPELILPALMPWLVFAGACAMFFFSGKVLGLSRAATGCLILTAGLGNTSFLGLPMIDAFYGKEYLGIGLVCDQAGSFMVLSTLGIVIAATLSGKALSKKAIAGRVLLFPPFLSVLLALALKPVAYPAWVETLLTNLGVTLSPLALLSVGMALRLSALRGNGSKLVLGLGYKMVLAPLVIAALYAGLLAHSSEVIRVTLFEAAMPPMITGGIVAMQYDLEPDLAALLLGIGIPLSFATLPLAWYLLQGL